MPARTAPAEGAGAALPPGSQRPADRRVTTTDLRGCKGKRKIAALTAYDATFARLFDSAHVDLLLVGDTLGMVVQGNDDTLSVTVDEIIYHTRAVVRGSRRALVVADMPFMSYQVSAESALVAAGRLLKEGGAQAVKVEGGSPDVAETVRRLVGAGIPVMGHVGLLPQSVHAVGGFRVQGREAEAQKRVVEDARALDAAGVFGIVLEAIPQSLAEVVTREVSVPTIGIGAGPRCDGQVLVCYDLLGLFQGFVPRFVKRYAQFGDAAVQAAQHYVEEVRAGAFPSAEHSFSGKLRAGAELQARNEARYAAGGGVSDAALSTSEGLEARGGAPSEKPSS